MRNPGVSARTGRRPWRLLSSMETALSSVRSAYADRSSGSPRRLRMGTSGRCSRPPTSCRGDSAGVSSFRYTDPDAPPYPTGCGCGQPATTSIFGTFQPETLSTGVAPCRSEECQVTVMVCDSPGHNVMSLPVQMADCSWLSPDSSVPNGVPRRMSARRKNPTVGADEVLAMVTVVSRSAPAGASWLTVVAVAETVAWGRLCSAFKLAYDLTLACGLPIVLFQLMTSGVVGCQ